MHPCGATSFNNAAEAGVSPFRFAVDGASQAKLIGPAGPQATTDFRLEMDSMHSKFALQLGALKNLQSTQLKNSATNSNA